MASFTSLVKGEIATNLGTKAENIAEISAIFNLAAIYDDSKIKLHTENPTIARHIYTLIKEVYNISSLVTIRKQKFFDKNYLYITSIYDYEFVIRKDLSLVDKNNQIKHIPDDYIISDEETKRAYLRGVFLIKGSVNDPKTARYHLEIATDHKQQAEFIKKIINSFNLNSKIIKRTNNYTIYIKEAEKISDFLRIINAGNAVMYFEDIRIYRDHKNMTNRLNNCEQANIEKTISSSNQIIEDINYLKEIDCYNLLPEDVAETGLYRVKYPESSLNELSAIIAHETGKSLSKSGINHRLRKIKELAKKLRK